MSKLPTLNPKFWKPFKAEDEMKAEFMKSASRMTRGIVNRSGSELYVLTDVKIFKHTKQDRYMIKLIDDKGRGYGYVRYSKEKDS